jgi:hypothetical protein
MSAYVGIVNLPISCANGQVHKQHSMTALASWSRGVISASGDLSIGTGCDIESLH